MSPSEHEILPLEVHVCRGNTWIGVSSVAQWLASCLERFDASVTDEPITSVDGQLSAEVREAIGRALDQAMRDAITLVIDQWELLAAEIAQAAAPPPDPHTN